MIDMVSIIEKKKGGQALTDEEIRGFVAGVTDGSIPDYQISALLMAICFQGMDRRETFCLTDAMLHSGQTMDLHDIKGIKVAFINFTYSTNGIPVPKPYHVGMLDSVHVKEVVSRARERNPVRFVKKVSSARWASSGSC